MVYVNLKLALVVAVILAIGAAIWWHHRPKVTLINAAGEIPEGTVVQPVAPVVAPVSPASL